MVESSRKYLCFDCVTEAYLREQVEVSGMEAVCSYCGESAKSFPIEDMAERVEKAFEQHFRRSAERPNDNQWSMLADKESSYDWEREGEPVIDAILNAAGIPIAAAEDIQTILEEQYRSREADQIGEETEFSSDSYYEETDVDDLNWHMSWNTFERSLKNEARFFSSAAAAYLTSIFVGIDKMTGSGGKRLVINAGPETQLKALYRARVFQSDEKLKTALCRPDLHLGPPPARFATAGRMNAQGIAVFYGANKPSVAIAEVRPPVGTHVIVARFELIRKLRLLDLTALKTATEPGSIFDTKWADRLSRAKFLRALSEHMIRPVRPDDEDFDYLPTQAIADFLAASVDPVIDGIVFPSAQTAGKALNVVLFHKAAKVQPLDVPNGNEITADTATQDDDGWVTQYSVTETESVEKEQSTVSKEESPSLRADFFLLESSTYVKRKASLRADQNSLHVHMVRSVKIATLDFKVKRHLRKKGDFEKF